jgi:hypothetical protein
LTPARRPHPPTGAGSRSTAILPVPAAQGNASTLLIDPLASLGARTRSVAAVR